MFTHHSSQWIGGFCIVGGGSHIPFFMVQITIVRVDQNNLLDQYYVTGMRHLSPELGVCMF